MKKPVRFFSSIHWSKTSQVGITVNAVAPVPVQTGWMSPDMEQQIVDSIPLRRVGTPEEIADAIVFLASYQARWISGHVIQVAGGHAL